jgi:hypothetical protein
LQKSYAPVTPVVTQNAPVPETDDIEKVIRRARTMSDLHKQAEEMLAKREPASLPESINTQTNAELHDILRLAGRR